MGGEIVRKLNKLVRHSLMILWDRYQEVVKMTYGEH